MKKILISLLVALLVITGFSTTAVLAKENQTNGTPFDEIWAAIKSLQEQVANITHKGDELAKTKASWGEWVADSENISGETWTVIPFCHSNTAGGLGGFDPETHSFTAPVTGIYAITATITGVDNGDGNKRNLSLAGVLPIGPTVYLNPVQTSGSLGVPLYHLTWTGRLLQGNTVKIMLKHDSAVDIKITGGYSILRITKLFNLE